MTPGLRTWIAFWTISAIALCRAASADEAPMPRAPQSGEAALRDLQLTLQVRRALSGDESLARANVGVHVERGVATLWGWAPSAAEAMRCLAAAKRVPGLDEVRSEMWIAPAAGPMVAPPRPEEKEKANSTNAAPGRLTARPADEATSDPFVEAPNPVSLGMPQFGPQASAAAHAEKTSDLINALSALRKKDERFGLLNAALCGDRVVVTGVVQRAGDLIDFEQALRALPGVHQIDAEGVRLAPNLSSSTPPIVRDAVRDLRIGR